MKITFFRALLVITSLSIAAPVAAKSDDPAASVNRLRVGLAFGGGGATTPLKNVSFCTL